MLIEFCVSNFRSIKDEQCFSMAAGSGKELLDSNTFDPGIPGVPRLVRASLLCGPNASGKSNFVRAMSFVASFVAESAAESKPGDSISVDPFLLDVDTANKPSSFDVSFVCDKVRYQYGFELDSERVLAEWLYAAPEGRTQCWFERDAQNVDEEWYFGPNLRGRKQVIKDSTRENALFLSTGAQLNNTQLSKVWGWFDDTLRPLSHPNVLSSLYSTYFCEDEEGREQVTKIMRDADLGIDGIVVERSNWGKIEFPEHTPEEVRKQLLSELPDQRVEAFFTHKRTGDDKPVQFRLDDESAGTQRIFALAGPWLDVLNKGFVLVLDELDSSLHPFLAERLVKYFLSKNTNSNNAQLIFTAHNPYLLNTGLLRRDQVWFVAKPRQSTQLMPHTDFHPRKNEDRMRNYLGGRYGALPFLVSGSDV